MALKPKRLVNAGSPTIKVENSANGTATMNTSLIGKTMGAGLKNIETMQDRLLPTLEIRMSISSLAFLGRRYQVEGSLSDISLLEAYSTKWLLPSFPTNHLPSSLRHF